MPATAPPVCEAIEDMLMMRPPGDRIMSASACETRRTPFRLMPRVSSQMRSSSSAPVLSDVVLMIPALLTSTSTVAYARRIFSANAATSARLLTSTVRALARHPIWAQASFSRAWSRPATTVRYPSCASRRATARPMPDEPPVTTATLPAPGLMTQPFLRLFVEFAGRDPFPSLLGKVAIGRMGCGQPPQRRPNCASLVANLQRYGPAFHTPSVGLRPTPSPLRREGARAALRGARIFWASLAESQ